jgi:hypothetical protein
MEKIKLIDLGGLSEKSPSIATRTVQRLTLILYCQGALMGQEISSMR